MSKQLVIVLSGRKQSGKSTSANHVQAYFLNAGNNTEIHKTFLFDKNKVFGVDDETGKLTCRNKDGIDFIEDGADFTSLGIKQYSFADPLKEFCVNVLGAKHEQCYGTDAQKDSPIPHLLWENVPADTRGFTEVYCKVEDGQLYPGYMERTYKAGPMTGRELMQWFGTDVCRKLYGDIWARGTYTKIKNEGYPLAIVTDGRFPNEINIGSEVDAKTIRLGRVVKHDNHPSESALDAYPKENYSGYLDNSSMTIQEQGAAIEAMIAPWFAEAGLTKDEQRRTSIEVSPKKTCGCGGAGACRTNAK